MMKNNYAVPRESNAKKAKSTFDNDEQLCGRSERYEMREEHRLFLVMRNNCKFQMITTGMKAQSILDGEEQICGPKDKNCQKGTVYSWWWRTITQWWQNRMPRRLSLPLINTSNFEVRKIKNARNVQSIPRWWRTIMRCRENEMPGRHSLSLMVKNKYAVRKIWNARIA